LEGKTEKTAWKTPSKVIEPYSLIGFSVFVKAF